jgi:HPt (histidine-containing phosphotransfer) domain-containing protein
VQFTAEWPILAQVGTSELPTTRQETFNVSVACDRGDKMKLLLCVALSVAIPGICAGQSASPSEQTLQAILSELRAIHADMRVETARTQSMELLLAELQIQAATVARAVQRVDVARSKTSDVQEGIRHTMADMTKVEEAQNTAATEADKSRLASDMDRLKSGLSSIKKLEQDRLSNQQEAEASLRKTQDAYDAIEDQLNALMKTLRTAQEVGNK